MPQSGRPLPFRTRQLLSAVAAPSVGLLNEYLKLSPGRRLLFKLVQDKACNAFARIEGEHAIIGVNAGLVIAMANMFRHMCGGRVTIRESPQAGLSTRYVNDLWLFGLPRDDFAVRHQAALLSIALRFVLIHELTHLRYGHVGLLREHGGLLQLDERPVEHGQLDSLERQTLEWDADQFAALDVFTSCVKDVEQYHPLAAPLIELLRDRGHVPPEELARATDSKAAVVYLVATAIAMFFYLFDSAWPENLDVRTHPPARLRASVVLGFVFDMAKDRDIELDPDVAIMMSAWAEFNAEKQLSYQSGRRRLSREEAMRPYTDESRAYTDRLRQAYRRLRPELLRHSWTPRLPPAT